MYIYICKVYRTYLYSQ